MATEVIALCVPQDMLNEAVRSVAPFEWMIAERRLVRDHEADFRLAPYDPAEDWASWDEGRLFGAGSELHWVRHGSTFQCVAIGDFHLPPGLEQVVIARRDLVGLTRRRTRALLWGTYDEQHPGTWWEARIPRTFSYPLPAPGDRPCLTIVEYLDPESGEVLWSQSAGLTTYKEGDDAQSL